MMNTATTLVTRSLDGKGWCVAWHDGPEHYFADAGGSWILDRDGALGHQMEGTSDVRIPRDHAAIRKFLEGRAPFEGETIKIEAANAVKEFAFFKAYDLKDTLARLGGKWEPSTKAWVLTQAQYDAFLAVVADAEGRTNKKPRALLAAYEKCELVIRNIAPSAPDADISPIATEDRGRPVMVDFDTFNMSRVGE